MCLSESNWNHIGSRIPQPEDATAKRSAKPLESDVPHNQPGETESEAGGKVVPFPGDWLGPRDELVPFGPRARMERDRVSEDGDEAGEDPGRRGPGEEHSSTRPGVAADDFWGGLADAGDLIQFPAEPAVATAAGSTTRRRLPVRVVAVGAAVLCVALIGARLWAGAGGGTVGVGAGLSPAAILPLAGPVVDQQQMHQVGVRGPASTRPRARGARAATHPAHRASRVVVVRRASRTSGHSQAVVYSPTAPTQPTAPLSSGSGGGSGGGGGGGGGGSGRGGSGGGGGRSHGSAARSAGPRGPGAAFGPGKVGG